MEEEEEPLTPLTPAQPTSPFWLPSSKSSRFRPTFGFVLNTGFLVVLLTISAIAFLAIQTPSLISFSQHVLRPSSVRRGWDSLNLILVLFAIVCGFLGRKDSEDNSSIDDVDVQESKAATPQLVLSDPPCNWNSYGLRRSFRSYPDLRQESLWEYNPRPRSFDDSYVSNSPKFMSSAKTESFRSQQVDDVHEQQQKNDDFDEKTLTPEDSVPTPISQDPPTPASDLSIKGNQEFPSIRRKARRRTRRLEPREAQSPPPARTMSQTPSSPPLPAVGQQESEEQSATNTPKKRGGMTKEIISSIYHPSKRKKKQRRRSQENLEYFDQVTNPNPSFHPSPPPSPPSMFHSIFSSKKGKSGKKISSAPPPPRRRQTIESHSIANTAETKTRFTLKADAHRTESDVIEQIVGDGSESPLIPIPPPPPPPPFKFRSWKFTVEGDYVKIASSGGSELEESDVGTPLAAENTASQLTCPSPDVNLKADDFIARFRSKLKLEKMNSINQKHEMGTGFSPLGPYSSSSPN